MSAANRTPGQRVADDVYETPVWAVERLLDAFALPQPFDTGWLEPCAGSGAIIKAVDAWCAQQRVAGPMWTANELRSEAEIALRALTHWVQIGDFHTVQPDARRFDVAITNPPYALAQEVIEHCLTLAKEVWMLLRVNFLGSEKRETFFEEHGLPDVYVLPNRPSFGLDKTGKVGSDATEYAWMKWTAADQPQQEGKLYRLALTPAAELAKAKALIRARGVL